MVSAILFDFYGVFQADVYQRWLDTNNLSRTGPFLALIQELDSGRIDHSEFTDELSKYCGRVVTYDEIYSTQAFNAEVIQIARVLGKKYKVGLLSNASPSLRQKIEANNLTDIFDSITISSEVGIAKPADKIYLAALTSLGAKPQETIYIDDNPDFIGAGKHIGLDAILFTSASQLQKDLRDRHIHTD